MNKLWLIPVAILFVFVMVWLLNQIVDLIFLWAMTTNNRVAAFLHRHRSRWYGFKRAVRIRVLAVFPQRVYRH